MEEIARRVENTSVYTDEEFARIAEQPAHDFLPIIQVIWVISFIVGIAVLGSTIYSATIERAREYGLMKVLGASPLRLYRIVLSQSATIATLGFGGGVGLAFLANRVAGDVVPQYVTYIRWQDVVFALGVAALMTFVASFLPINRVARVDPASVFRP
jgi:putative ABC transport system permease protein